MKSNRKVIVSLTSWPPAIGFVPAAVHSIFEGTVVPDKVVLYLDTPEFPDGAIPEELEALRRENPRFEVRFYDGAIRSYTKLVPALADFPDDVVITIDDDIHYNKRMVERLLLWHQRYPEAIIAHNVRQIMTDRDGRLKGYFQWKRYKPHRYLWQWPRAGFDNLLFGLGGVLYPPHSLDEAMMRPELFTSMAPTVDDVWFWAAATSRGTKVLPVPFGFRKPRELGKPAAIALGTGNTRSGKDVNKLAVEAILEKYPVVRERLEQETGPISL